MPTYRTVNLADGKILYVKANNKSQARSHVARSAITVGVASMDQLMADLKAKVDVNPETAGEE